MNHTWRSALAEGYGTFALVFAGAGAIVVNDASGGAVTHVGVALTFGLVVMALVYALGDISGAHLNPAVTLGFIVSRRMAVSRAGAYVVAQAAGALLAAACLRLLFPDHPTLGGTAPAGSAAQSFGLEVLLTTFLMLVILGVSTGAKEKGTIAGIAVGGTVALEALFAGPISGASMNPARSLGPALVSGATSDLWIYLTAPLVGALVACAAWRSLQPARTPQTRDSQRTADEPIVELRARRSATRPAPGPRRTSHR